MAVWILLETKHASQDFARPCTTQIWCCATAAGAGHPLPCADLKLQCWATTKLTENHTAITRGSFCIFPWFMCHRVQREHCSHTVCWNSLLFQVEMCDFVGQCSVSAGWMGRGNSPHSLRSPWSDTRQVAER